jgi:hypothetical protein
MNKKKRIPLYRKIRAISEQCPPARRCEYAGALVGFWTGLAGLVTGSVIIGEGINYALETQNQVGRYVLDGLCAAGGLRYGHAVFLRSGMEIGKTVGTILGAFITPTKAYKAFNSVDEKYAIPEPEDLKKIIEEYKS